MSSSGTTARRARVALAAVGVWGDTAAAWLLEAQARARRGPRGALG